MDCAEMIRRKALSLGFDLCGVARVRVLREPADRFERWIEQGCDGGLEYMRRHRSMRFDPDQLLAGAQSVVVCGVSYHRAPSAGEVAHRIASYAHNRDYHLVLREPLRRLADELRCLVPESRSRVFIDTAPLSEKSWAVEAGLGWIGRHSLLINPDLGSFLLLGEVLTSAQLTPDSPFVEMRCGTCHACVEACPVGAIRDDRTIDARRCIARRTIERGGDQSDLHGWIFGCDLCQRACPHNAKAPFAHSPLFNGVERLEQMTREQWLDMDEQQFDQWFGDTPLARCGLENLKHRLEKL